MYKVFYSAIFILGYIRVTFETPLTNSEIFVSDNILKSYLEDIEKNKNPDINKCDYFTNYACKTIKNNLPGDEIQDHVREYFVNNEPKNEGEIKVRDMFLSCEKELKKHDKFSTERIKTILEQVPEFKFNNEVTSDDIVKLISILKYNENSYLGPLQFDISSHGKFKINVNFDSKFLKDHENYGKNILKLANYEDGISDLEKFVEEYQKLLNSLESKKITNKAELYTKFSLSQLKENLPSTTFDWVKMIELLSHEKSETVEVKVGDLEIVKELVKLFDSTKIQTIYNFYLSNYIMALSERQCDDFKYFYEFVVRSHEWHELFGDKESNERYIKFLADFEKIFDNLSTLTKFDHDKISYMKENLKQIKTAIEKNQNIYSNELCDTIYKNIDIDSENFYKNLVKLQKIYSEDEMKFKKFIDDDIKSELSNMYFLKSSPIFKPFKGKPYLYFYTVINNYLWDLFFDYHQENHDIKDFHITTSFDFERNQYTDAEKQIARFVFLNSYFMKDFQTTGFSLLTLSKATNVTENGLHEEYDIMKETEKFSINDLFRVFITGLFQFHCNYDQIQSDVFRIEKFYKSFKVFANSFNCFETAEGKVLQKLIIQPGISTILEKRAYGLYPVDMDFEY